MTIIFKGTFESGTFSEFTSVTGAPIVSNLAAKNGTYGARCITMGIGTEAALEYVIVNKTIPSGASYYAQVMVRLNTNLSANGNRVTVISNRAGTVAAGSAGIQNVNGVLKWYILKATKDFAAIGPVVGQWYCMELYQHGIVGGTLDLYIDGVLVLSQAITAAGSWSGVNFGAAANTNYAVSLDIDDCAIADAYIGPGTILPKLTVNSSPELNVPVYVDDQFIGNTPLIVELPSGTHAVRVEQEITR